MVKKRLTAIALALCWGGGATAQVSVFGGANSQATICASAALSGHATPDAITTCTLALEHEPLVGRDLAGTHVNRGVLYLRNRDLRQARADFDTALSIVPTMGEALVNRGAVKIAERQWADGVADIDRGLALGSEQPEKAYYNRGLAKERLDDVKGAYLDYLKASQLAPAWPAPQVELKRFTVARAGG